ncbi:MAG: DUF98 domain-containing protein [Chromatiales bacterium]|nr:DUF98 domain-containing protein [Chromatiales bacterium]
MESTTTATQTSFDPAAPLYHGARPPGVQPVEVARLTPWQRVLLVADGTVTRLLEAWALEPVSVRLVRQRQVERSLQDDWLGSPFDGPVIERTVILSGATSGRFFLYAESLILPGRLPAGLQDALSGSSGGLGQILDAAAVESRREGLWFGRLRRDGLPEEAAMASEGEFLARCYRLLVGGRPAMRITEYFPWVATHPGPLATDQGS